MKTMICCIALALLCGCATKPPQPVACKGQFRPVNPLQQGASVALNVAGGIPLCFGGRHG